MIKYILDTNICIYIIKKRPISVFDRFKQLKVGQICISSITYCELQFGVFNSSKPKENEMTLNKFLGPIEVLEFPVEAGPVYGRIRYNLKSKGTLIGGNDLLIASHAIAGGFVLVTNNTKEFGRIDELKCENWS